MHTANQIGPLVETLLDFAGFSPHARPFFSRGFLSCHARRTKRKRKSVLVVQNYGQRSAAQVIYLERSIT